MRANDGVTSLPQGGFKLRWMSTHGWVHADAPVQAAYPCARGGAGVDEETVLVFDRLEPEEAPEHNPLVSQERETYVCVCPETSTSTSSCLAMAFSESRSPVGTDWWPCITPIRIGVCATVTDKGKEL